MAVAEDNFFSYGRALPDPYKSYKTVSVASKYAPSKTGGGASTTLCPSIIKALHAVCACMDGSGKGAVGVVDHRCVAEYKSSVTEEEYHIVAYDSKTGLALASVYNTGTKNKEVYIMNRNNRDGAALLMAMFPEFDKDEEFHETFQAYYVEYAANFPNLDTAAELVGILCDNVYRRIKDKSCVAHVKTKVDIAGNFLRLTGGQLDSGEYKPKKVIAGEFCIFDDPKTKSNNSRPVEVVPFSEFVGQYNFHQRTFNEQEQMQIPELPLWYIIPKQAVQICKHVKETTGTQSRMRNFLMRGPAGTGKTWCSKAIAAACSLPYMKYTCSSDTEIYDFIGQFIPIADEGTKKQAAPNMEVQALQEMGGITYENVAKMLGIPDLTYLEYDPEGAYEKLTGETRGSVSITECVRLIFEKIMGKLTEIVKTASDGGQKFTYVETDFIRAIRNGYLVEIQEPTLITRPGVMVGLNSLLEQDGTITLPNGETIKRHPDTIVVITTNATYEGCRNLNQSMVDRMNLVLDVDAPTPEEMIQRTMSYTGETDEHQVSQMVDVVNKMIKHCRANNITDGCVGMRSLIDWAVSTRITGDPYESALHTIISKATSDEGDRQELITAILEQTYLPKEQYAV